MSNHLFRGVGRLSNLTFTTGKGSFLNTVCGRSLLDFTSGIGVTNTGHCHPKIVEAAKAQCDKIIHAQINLGYHEPMLELTETLLGSMPSKKLDRIFYSTTGAEAVENAVKLAKYATGRPNIICFQGGYHGRTQLTMGLTTSSVIYRQKMAPTTNIFVSSFPYELHDGPDASQKCLTDLQMLFRQQTLPEEVAAVIIEPVLGEGGYVPVPVAFMKGLRDICDEHGILLIVDEVQSGFARTGCMFSSDYYQRKGIEPDILVMAKGLASGFPLSAVASRSELTEKQEPGTMGGTYAGNAVSCAAAIATQHVIREERLVENSKLQGERLWRGLKDLEQKYDVIRDVRGPGCMVGVELQEDVAPGTSKKLSLACLKNGMLLLSASIFPTVRFIPALTVSEEEIDMGLDIFEKSLKQVV
jgi:4-aminobutyrate aminotransferase